MSPLLLFQWFFLGSLVIFTCSTSTDPILTQKDEHLDKSKIATSNGWVGTLYPQTLDHFSYTNASYQTFSQKYYTDDQYWGGASSNSPIFAYLGEEQELIPHENFLTDSAPGFKALLLFIEHRFYGKSTPAGPLQDLGGYFNSAQALADYAEIIIHVKKQFKAENCPVIVAGGSYGGMLAAWFRLKYPHIALGALASSAPVLLFEDITPHDGFYSVISQDFKDASPTCYQTIKDSWREIDKTGLVTLRQQFPLCSGTLVSTGHLKGLLKSMYTRAAQYNAPPTYEVTKICDAIDKTRRTVLDKILASVVASHGGRQQCYFNNRLNVLPPTGWGWQTCTEMVMPLGVGNNSMFEPDPFNLTEKVDYCKAVYGVSPRPNWVTTYYGGHNISVALKRFGSNIIFTNGLKDPWSCGGVLKNISTTIKALTTKEGSHCLDLLHAQPTDPQWLLDQRASMKIFMQEWIDEYNEDIKPTISTFFKRIGKVILQTIV